MSSAFKMEDIQMKDKGYNFNFLSDLKISPYDNGFEA